MCAAYTYVHYFIILHSYVSAWHSSRCKVLKNYAYIHNIHTYIHEHLYIYIYMHLYGKVLLKQKVDFIIQHGNPTVYIHMFVALKVKEMFKLPIHKYKLVYNYT